MDFLGRFFDTDLSYLASQGFPRTAARNALAFAGGDVADARDLLIHQSHIRGWEREAAVLGIPKSDLKPTRIGGPNCPICAALKVLRHAGGMRIDNAAYTLYGSRHAVRMNPPPGADAPTGQGWIFIPSSSGRGFYVVEPELLLQEGDEANGDGEEAQKRSDGDGGRGNPRWGDCEERLTTSVRRPRYARYAY